MIELFNYFCSVEFLGIILLSGGWAFLLIPEFYGFFVASPRHFWFPALTYSDNNVQSQVRSAWLGGILLAVIGIILIAANDTRIPDGIGWVILEIVYLLLVTWVLLKAILLIAIAISALWNWAVRGTPLFKKDKTQKGNA